ncbi:hypothetical protein OIU74_023127 [Salix koriyanagi]|uniref:Uncharacterized protein n=1 Tax=Salix koriyanagi TaxID=2511006 RepID=A0A9Q1AAS3_9ROSI|nr:hypothetical protein OIU74_023127 [Salix koriyanagi]
MIVVWYGKVDIIVRRLCLVLILDELGLVVEMKSDSQGSRGNLMPSVPRSMRKVRYHQMKMGFNCLWRRKGSFLLLYGMRRKK